MMNSVLLSVRDYLAVPDGSYDDIIKAHINTTWFGLYQLGVMPVQTVSDELLLWSSVSATLSNPDFLPLIKTVTCLRVKLLFDVSSSQIELIMTTIQELESRMLIETDLTVSIVP